MKSVPVEEAYLFCPQCGTRNETVGEIPFRCSQCDFANFFGPVAAVGGLVVNKQKELLFVRRARDPGKGKWGLPGGFVDRNETIEQSLEREVLEETNLEVTQYRLLMTYPNQYNYRGVVAPVIDFFYLCEVDPDAKISLAAEELEIYKWAKPSAEFLDNMAFESNRIAVQHWMEAGQG